MVVRGVNDGDWRRKASGLGYYIPLIGSFNDSVGQLIVFCHILYIICVLNFFLLVKYPDQNNLHFSPCLNSF